MDASISQHGMAKGRLGAAPRATAPIVVSLDRVLVQPNLVAERALAYLRGDPLRILHLLLWLLRGRGTLGRELARRVPEDSLVLPLDHHAVEALAEQAQATGRAIHLAAAGRHEVARAVADRLGCVDGIVPGHGDAAPTAAVSGSGWRTLRAQLPALLQCARPHQWAKNVLVFVPAILSGTIAHEATVLRVTLACLALCVLASSTYLLNDLWDVADDRRHWSKRRRPLASGRLPLTTAMIAAPLGIAFALVLGALVSVAVAEVLACYLAVTLAYSFALKRVPIIDVTTLAGLFTLRLVLGIAAAGVFASPWLLTFSMFLFGSLCFAKRHVELERAMQRGTDLSHRGYRRQDAMLLLVLGLTSSVASVLVMVLYIIFDAFHQTFYGNTAWLWAFPVVLFLWTARIWLVAGRGELDDDPVAFAVRDTPSVLLGAVMTAAFLLAWSGLFA